MKTFFLILLILRFGDVFSQSGNTFDITSSWGAHQIVLNGDTVLVDSSFTELPTRYPVFDTLYMDGRGPILCNFKPDSSYTLIMACCGSLDILQTSKWNRWQQVMSAHQDSIFGPLEAYPYWIDTAAFYMQLTSPTEDTVYGWYADYACFPTLERIGAQEMVRIPVMKCYYWSNINRFQFFTSEEDYLQYANENGDIEDIFRKTGSRYGDEKADPILGEIAVRLFDEGVYLTTCNPMSGETHLKRLD